MSAPRSHTDRGQLFGWDGSTMWVDQALPLAAPAEHVECAYCEAGEPFEHQAERDSGGNL